ncbi:hypothetical protein L1987_29158 [Smallanthus sonchifolius]|uniref:Uncharacterized protein n=1 Tax=Smallanthus sonchifolius TaxID=185202 RepID=A0ACB9I1W0_9ASTR|nr:hypothetical protein L1987_29158 [Smallanthus sonchifolius]
MPILHVWANENKKSTKFKDQNNIDVSSLSVLPSSQYLCSFRHTSSTSLIQSIFWGFTLITESSSPYARRVSSALSQKFAANIQLL